MRKFNKKKLPSRHTSLGPDRAPHRSFYYAMGETEKDVSKPFIGVVSTWNEAAPCNIALMRQIKQLELTPESSDVTPTVVDGKEFAIIKIRKGLEVLEKLISTHLNGKTNMFAAGTSEPSIADMCIIPQLYNGKKFGVDLSKFPTLLMIQSKCENLNVFVNAHPFQQPDAPATSPS